MKAAIFDMDGTLLDSMGVWENLGQDYLQTLGITPPENLRETIRAMSFPETADYFIRTFHLSSTPEELIAAWNATAVAAYRAKAKVKPFAKEYLALLAAKGVRLCVATATNAAIAHEILSKNGIFPLLEFILTEEEAGVGKASPDIYFMAAERLGVQPRDCVVFEDAYHAVKTAKEAGFTVYAVEDRSAEAYREEIIKICDKYTSFEEEFSCG